ncbi:hypothetical protein [Legionella sp. W05-934-2]|uniref:hypothetical protein n=1 Tax=Legionella sp. W05-934-2 TaxID=1198649 RepID=UPI0034635241
MSCYYLIFYPMGLGKTAILETKMIVDENNTYPYRFFRDTEVGKSILEACVKEGEIHGIDRERMLKALEDPNVFQMIVEEIEEPIGPWNRKYNHYEDDFRYK